MSSPNQLDLMLTKVCSHHHITISKFLVLFTCNVYAICIDSRPLYYTTLIISTQLNLILHFPLHIYANTQGAQYTYILMN